MIYGSVCSGIEAASQAWSPLGWSPAFFAEVDKFPSAVLSHHYGSNMPGDPYDDINGVPNYGDMSKFKEWPDHANLDVLVGGTPCQSFSVAGLRKGMDDPRGNLALVYLGLADRYRPDWLVWENVPGVLSSNEGRDFGAFLGGLGKLGYGFAYRVLDAQYIRVDGYARAVPQRRRRVFVVGYLGDWRRAAAVLFEPESLRRDTPPRRKAGQGVAPTISARTKGGGGLGTDFECDGGLIPDVARALLAKGNNSLDNTLETYVAGTLVNNGKAAGSATNQDAENGLLVAHSLRAEGFDASEDGTGRGTPLVPVGFAQNQRDEVRQMDVAGALAAEPGMKQQTYVAYRTSGNCGAWETGDTVDALTTFTDPNSHVVSVADTLGVGANQTTGFQSEVVANDMAVRRLTPRECERLQGFPDDYTLIPYRGKDAADCPDGPRYKALGNSMAVNVMRWIGARIDLFEKLEIK